MFLLSHFLVYFIDQYFSLVFVFTFFLTKVYELFKFVFLIKRIFFYKKFKIFTLKYQVFTLSFIVLGFMPW